MLKHLKNWFAPATALQFQTAILNHKGGRDNLEDAAGFSRHSQQIGCWMVADGVGGQGAGEMAAQLAVDSVLQGFNTCPVCSERHLRDLLENAHQAISSARQIGSFNENMATTAVALLADHQNAVSGHVGDSRLYHFRANTIIHRTEDQSLVNMLIARGTFTRAESLNFAQRHVILHALGQEKPPVFSIQHLQKLQAGDGFLLCTDGVWELLSDAELLACWQASGSAQDWCAALELQLTQRSAQQQAAGESPDNFTAVVIKVVAD